MAYVTSTTDLETYHTALIAARTAILSGKSYSIGGRTLTRVDEKWLSSEIEKTEARLSRRASGGNSVNPVFIVSRG